MPLSAHGLHATDSRAGFDLTNSSEGDRRLWTIAADPAEGFHDANAHSQSVGTSS